jgi:hypothetical protein
MPYVVFGTSACKANENQSALSITVLPEKAPKARDRYSPGRQPRGIRPRQSTPGNPPGNHTPGNPAPAITPRAIHPAITHPRQSHPGNHTPGNPPGNHTPGNTPSNHTPGNTHPAITHPGQSGPGDPPRGIRPQRSEPRTRHRPTRAGEFTNLRERRSCTPVHAGLEICSLNRYGLIDVLVDSSPNKVSNRVRLVWCGYRDVPIWLECDCEDQTD